MPLTLTREEFESDAIVRALLINPRCPTPITPDPLSLKAPLVSPSLQNASPSLPPSKALSCRPSAGPGRAAGTLRLCSSSGTERRTAREARANADSDPLASGMLTMLRCSQAPGCCCRVTDLRAHFAALQNHLGHLFKQIPGPHPQNLRCGWSGAKTSEIAFLTSAQVWVGNLT